MRANGLRLIVGSSLAAAAALLAGCGEPDRERVSVPTPDGPAIVTTQGDANDGTVTVQGPDGSQAVIGAGAAASVAGFPPFAQPYPGATVESTQTAETEGERGGMLSFTSDAAPGTIVEWYRQRAEAAGLTTTGQVTQGETRSFQAEAEGVGANVVVIVMPADGRSSGLVTWSSGG